MKRLLIIWPFLFIGFCALAQPKHKQASLADNQQKIVKLNLKTVLNDSVFLAFRNHSDFWRLTAIGDEIEVSGQAGRVKEIGLRASTLYTADGAEVIIPNGNILSQNIVNWTFTNDQKRVAIWFILSGTELDANVINEVINNTLSNIPDVISLKKPVILYTRVTSETCTLTVRLWSTIKKAEHVKSEALLLLRIAFAAKNIQFE